MDGLFGSARFVACHDDKLIARDIHVDVLEFVLASVFKDNVKPSTNLPIDVVGDANTARLSHAF